MKRTVLLDTSPTARHMFGCYATADDDTFLDVITDELDQFQSSADTSSCVNLLLVVRIRRFCDRDIDNDLFSLLAVFFFSPAYRHDIDCCCIDFARRTTRISSVSLLENNEPRVERSSPSNRN